MLVKLTQLTGPKKDRSMTLRSPGRYIVGSGEAADFRVSHEDDPYVSAQQAVVEVRPSSCSIRSLAGLNPLIVNDKHVREKILQDGDVVKVGLTSIGVRTVLPRCHRCGRTDDGLVKCAESDQRFEEFSDIAVHAHSGCVTVDSQFAGRTIAGFEILTSLGVGGFGSVWLSYDHKTNRLWAVKQMKKWVGDQRRFKREGKFLTQHIHPLIVRCVDIGEDVVEGNYLVCEFVPGQDLSKLVRETGPPPVSWTIDLVLQILGGLHFLHTRSGAIIHRDIKPENVLLKGEKDQLTVVNPAAKIADLGIARALDGPGSTRYTEPGALPGTFYFLSPETLKGQPYGPSTDVYSAGVTAYYVLSGKYPYDFPKGADDYAMLYHVLTNEPKPLQERRPDISTALAAVVDQACCKNPAVRYGSALEFAHALVQSRRAENESIT